MSELFREIEEDMRRERLDRLWARFGRLAIGASFAVVVATGAYVFWQNHKQAAAMRETAKLSAGIARFDQKDYKGAIAAFDALTADSASPYYGIAMLRKARAQEAAGDKDAAAKTYAALAGQHTVFGALASMRTPPEHLAEPSTASPLFFSQSEWTGWQLLKQGKKDEAAARFLAVRDGANAPFSMRERMQETLQYLAPDKSAVSISKGIAHE